jgi:hypothetical protein
MLEVYPIGRATLPATLDLDAVAAAVGRIEELPELLRTTVAGCSDLDHPIRAGAWTIRQVVHHLADTHMNAFLRTKRVLTEVAPTVEPVELDGWARTSDAALAIEPSLDLLTGLHVRWAVLLRSLSPADLARPWHVHSDAAPREAWRLPLIYGWHGAHHAAQIRQARAHFGL